MTRRTVFRSVTIVTMNDLREVLFGDLMVEDNRIIQVGGSARARGSDLLIDGAGLVAVPGLIQAHLHLVQTLFRNQADDLELLDWLRLRIWPFEASHTEASTYASARLGICELLGGGTTAVLDMGTVLHHDQVFRAAEESGIRYLGGKAMMDLPGEGLPAALVEKSGRSLEESSALASRWHGKAGGRLRYAYCPRFVVSCTDELLGECARRAKELGTPVHVHASESRAEVEMVRGRTGHGNLDHLRRLGVLEAKAAVAHCIHLDPGDAESMAFAGASAVHCPTSNLKLASGIAPVPQLLQAGVNVALGADGAACNNTLDPFLEMRLAALLQKPRLGPKAIPAWQALWMATRGGARALGLEAEIGSIENGKRADLAFLDLSLPHTSPWSDPISATVYSARPENVRHVMVDGTLVKRDGELTGIDRREVAEGAVRALKAIQP